ncbi:DUF2625 family protein [Actinoplanes sp. NPDC020271]|uniref:DUF2625 family protein n=1 Tax=Actinoplanes sp. NPDC020271 TaxID=3363896 RepID=UPI0037AB37B1
MDPSAWDEITATIEAAPYPVRVLPADPENAEAALAALGVTTRSWLGAVVANTGGLLIDHGWMRVLGSGAEGLPDVLAGANPELRGLMVAYDILGGQFAWIPNEPGKPPTVHYFAPDTLEWEDLGQGYTDWLYAVLAGSLDAFYENLRWPGWESEAGALAADQGLTVFPPPWTKEGQDMAATTRSPAPLLQIVDFHHDVVRQLGGYD